MGRVRAVTPVKLIVGMIGNEEALFQQALAPLQIRCGPVDYQSDFIPFTFTQYYEKEMGSSLVRKFFSFENLVDPILLPGIKLAANTIEEELSLDSGEVKRRKINIDPGYVALSKLVLATTKERAHRIYIGEGIYAEVTLQYQEKSFCPWYWTYPDYRTRQYISIFNHIREAYASRLKELNLLPNLSGTKEE
ncbi:MAG: DUF4416 family protein [Vulcanimicrobiota bacterium]